MRLLSILCLGLLAGGLPRMASGQSERLSASLIRTFAAEAEVNREQLDLLAKRFDLPQSGTIQGVSYSLSRVVHGRPVYRATHNLAASLSAGVAGIRAGGWVGSEYLGTGQRIVIWDAETLLPEHVEFLGRVS
ncbi:MAG: hypothetical protein HKN29_08045, partial [Rhodothermales bacterium]|nr:hypothetical protein [Rhodothermales bacterium]